jgi:AcrR family transcriptional regulator
LHTDTGRTKTPKRVRLTRAESKARTRSALIDAAEEVFARVGYHAATIEEIAERAGFTRGAFYANFTDKADLFLTVHEERNEENLVQLRAELDALEGTATQPGYDAFSRWLERGFKQIGSLEMAYAEFQPFAATNPVYIERVAARLRTLRATAVAMLDDTCARLGVTLPIPAERFAAMAMALIDGFTTHHQIDPEGAPLEALVQGMEYLWRGVTMTARAEDR